MSASCSTYFRNFNLKLTGEVKEQEWSSTLHLEFVWHPLLEQRHEHDQRENCGERKDFIGDLDVMVISIYCNVISLPSYSYHERSCVQKLS
jgi:hypothetical protein